MRIGILTTSYPRWEGDEAGVFVERLVSGLAESGASGVIVVPHDKKQKKMPKASFRVRPYRYHLFSSPKLAFGSGIIPNLKANPLSIFQAPALLLGMSFAAWQERKKVDLYHANWLFAGIAAWLVHLFSSQPYVITLRGEDVRLASKGIFRFLFSPVIRSASCITSVNEAFCEEIKKNFKEVDEKLVCIENATELPDLSTDYKQKVKEKFSLSSEKKYAIFVGTLVSRKRVLQLLDLLALFPGELLIVGRTSDTAYTRKLEAQIKDKHLEDRVHILGAVEPNEVFALFSFSSLYVSASEHEGRPNALLEARAMGLPALCSNIEGHQEVLQDSADSFLFQNSILEAKNWLNTLSFDATASENPAQQVYSWADCAQRYLEVFHKSIQQ